jgi:hypothetical protein
MVPGKENEIIYSDSYSAVWSQKMKNFINDNTHVIIRSNMLNHEDSTIRLYIGPVNHAIAVDLSVRRTVENHSYKFSYDVYYWVELTKPNLEEYMERNLHRYLDMSPHTFIPKTIPKTITL